MKNNPCIRFSHFDSTGEPVYKNKKSFDTDKEAIEYAKMVNIKNADHIIHKQIAYKCERCGKWHIGKSSTILSEKNRDKLKKEGYGKEYI